MSHKILALCGATPVAFRGEEKSAIAKQSLAGKVHISKLGLIGDEQADLVHHGGLDMAVHHYPLDHHAYWRKELGHHPLLDEPGAFGTNLSIQGLTESDVLLGDRFRLGSAVIEVCQPRQPCWKIEHRFGEKRMVKRILSTARCGWYCRVIEEGEAEAGDVLERLESGLVDWSIGRIFEGIWGTSTPKDDGQLREITALPGLAEKLRKKLEDRLSQN